MTQQPPAYHDEVPPPGTPAPRGNMIPLGGASQTIQPVSAMGNAMVQEAVAKVQAAIILAKQFPRDIIRAKDSILNACMRESLAEQAIYEYARGGSKIEGPTIRLAETIAQNWGNIEFGWNEVSRGRHADGSGYSEIEAYAWDMETNVRRPTKFQVRHWRDTQSGGYALKDERDVYENNANMAARRLRGCILNLIPGDVIDEAVSQCESTLRDKVKVTPERIANMADAFSKFGVSKVQIEKRLQSRLDVMTPGQMLSLTKIYNSIRDGMSSPVEWFAGAEATEPVQAGNALDKFEAKVTKAKEPAPMAAQTVKEEQQAKAVEAVGQIMQEISVPYIEPAMNGNKIDWTTYFADCTSAMALFKTSGEFKAFREKNAEGISNMKKQMKSWADRLEVMIEKGEGV